MKKYVLFGHGGSGNHGCEALVRSTYKILNDNKSKFYLYSKNSQEDKQFGLNKIIKLIEEKEYKSISSRSLSGVLFKFRSLINNSLSFDTEEFKSNFRLFTKRNMVGISIGGDNYCYSASTQYLRNPIKALNIADNVAVLWGCSVDRGFLNQSRVKEIKRYALITARESLTIENLYECGIKDNIIFCSDPAFTLDTQTTDFKKEIFDTGNVIGLNASSLMSFYESYKDATIKNFITLIKYLLKNTDSYIALIPHVKGDETVLENIEQEIADKRVFVVGGQYNCMQLKYLISKCKTFVGCRTHSTIAAYSTCVPTLVVGYSVKSKGIAKDIFGDYKGLVVDGQQFGSDEDLTKAYIEFSEREKEIKDRLINFMPEYVARAYNGKEAVEKLFNK